MLIPQERLEQEINRRRSFAIIAHPDAGKTTLSEKMLLYGGAIHLAGHVRARKNRRKTRSDWMKLEKERGISVTSAALQFKYKNYQLNLLDTPGHEDFSEDTYRTLMAVDAAVMLLDAARGVETQTIKLFNVCRERKIPIVTFLNKMDMPAKDPFGLMDEIEKTLGITSCPFVWPIASGRDFRGFYDFKRKQVHWYDKQLNQEQTANSDHTTIEKLTGINDTKLKEGMEAETYSKFCEGAELAQEALPGFDEELFLSGDLSPVFFGSAIKNFGLAFFLKHFVELCPPPRSIHLNNNKVLDPRKNSFSGFVFKLQANMNQRHRDRIAFLRITSGVFFRGMNVYHKRLKKNIRLSNPISFFGQERNTVDEAFAGDIIGLSNPGVFCIGDIISSDINELDLPNIPRFAPESFVRLIPKDSSKLKSFHRGLQELGEEGVVQVFRNIDGQSILGAIGQLQFETFQYRLEDEYGAISRLDPMPYETSRWFNAKDKNKFSTYEAIIHDMEGRAVVLFRSKHRLKSFIQSNTDVKLSEHPLN